jgi:hypothetical protein
MGCEIKSGQSKKGFFEKQTKFYTTGADPTKQIFSNFTHICKIFLQICANFLTNL